MSIMEHNPEAGQSADKMGDPVALQMFYNNLSEEQLWASLSAYTRRECGLRVSETDLELARQRRILSGRDPETGKKLDSSTSLWQAELT